VPTVVLSRPVLWEVADIVEQIFRIAYTENLHPRPEEYNAATCDYAAEHGLSVTRLREQMRQYGTLSEIHQRAQVIALMRFYSRRWRPSDPEGGVRRHRKARRRGHRKFVRALKSSGVLSCPMMSDVAQTGHRPDKRAPPPATNILIQQSSHYSPPL
jgi:hypothetical protein